MRIVRQIQLIAQMDAIAIVHDVIPHEQYATQVVVRQAGRLQAVALAEVVKYIVMDANIQVPPNALQTPNALTKAMQKEMAAAAMAEYGNVHATLTAHGEAGSAIK